jgi:hypothetical protein
MAFLLARGDVNRRERARGLGAGSARESGGGTRSAGAPSSERNAAAAEPLSQMAGMSAIIAEPALDAGSANALPGAGSSSPSPVISEIRAVLVDNPRLAEELARADQERSPDSPDADERDALLVAAVFNQHHHWDARREARLYLQRHPDGRFAEFITEQTGAHVPRLPPGVLR